MYMMMTGHQGDSGHSGIEHKKEVETGKYSVNATFPPMRTREETSITLSIVDVQTQSFFKKADVAFTVQLVDAVTDHSMIQMEHARDSSEVSQMPAQKAFQQQLTESTPGGLFKFAYTPQDDGNYLLTLIVQAVDGIQLEKPIVMQEAKPAMGHKPSGDMGMMGSTSAIGIITVAVMATMMLISLAK